MTLDEFMSKVEAPNLIISIGSKSAYFFIGTRTEYEECIDLISEDFENDMFSTTRSYEVRAENCRTALKENLFKRSPMRTVEAQRDYAERSLKNALDIIEETKARLAKWTPFREREIKDTYKRLNINDGICVIVSGNEVGECWTREDFKQRKPKLGMGNQQSKAQRCNIAIARNLRKLRKAAGMTASQLAEASGLPEKAIRSYECAHIRPGRAAAKKLAKIFGVSVEELYMEGEAT